MASITKNEHKSYGMGLHDEVLTGRTQQIFFNPEEGENFFYNDAYDVDFTKPVAVIMGSEHRGINKSIINLSDEVVKLPMYGKIQSLNVSVACGVFLYEVVRQRI